MLKLKLKIVINQLLIAAATAAEKAATIFIIVYDTINHITGADAIS